jgi:hypothetical protein
MRLNRLRRIVTYAAVVGALASLSVARCGAQCLVLSVNHIEELRRAKTVAVRAPAVSPDAQPTSARGQYNAEPIEALGAALSERIIAELRGSNLFSRVAPDNGAQATDLMLEGTITRIVQGDRTIIVPIVPSRAPSVLEFVGTLRVRESRALLLQFVCGGDTGGIFKRPKEWMRHNVEMIARGLRDALRESLSQRDAAPLEATAERAARVELNLPSLSFPPDEWKLRAKAYAKTRWQIPPSLALDAASDVREDGTLAAAIVTRANRRVLLLAEGQTLRVLPAQARAPLEESHTPAAELQRAACDGDSLLVWVWYAKRGVACLEHGRLEAETTLRAGDASTPARPARVLYPPPYLAQRLLSPTSSGFYAGWVYHPLVFVFPRAAFDAGNTTTGRREPLLLRTRIDLRQVDIRLDAKESNADGTSPGEPCAGRAAW